MDASIVRESNVLMDNVFNPNPNVLLHHKLNKFKILFQIKYKMVWEFFKNLNLNYQMIIFNHNANICVLMAAANQISKTVQY